MKHFIELLSGANGISSKRSVMVWFVLLFSFVLIFNMATGKAPNPTLLDQLNELTIISIAAVFGERFIDFIKQKRSIKTQSNNQNSGT